MDWCTVMVTMKRRWQRCLAMLVLTASLSLHAESYAQQADPLWLKIVAKLQAIQQLAPKDIETTMDILAKEKTKRLLVQKQITGWDQQLPVYSNLKLTVIPPLEDPKKEIKPFDVKKMMDMMVGEIFTPEAKVSRTDGVSLAGKMWTLFELKQSGMTSVSMKIWVHPETTMISQHEIEAHIPMGFDAKIQTQYELTDSTANMPVSTYSKGEVLIPFRGMKFSITETFRNWISRPGKSSP